MASGLPHRDEDDNRLHPVLPGRTRSETGKVGDEDAKFGKRIGDELETVMIATETVDEDECSRIRFRRVFPPVGLDVVDGTHVVGSLPGVEDA